MLKDSAALFEEQLQYNDTTGVHGIAAMPQYNGNIASRSWGIDSLVNRSSFLYNYDRLNRLTSGVTANSAYAERSITYDQAGNIQTLSRVYGGGLIDSLAYDYNGT